MMTLLQTLRQVAEQSAVIAELDPHGIIVSSISIIAVFLSLLILFLAYLLIGKFVRIYRNNHDVTDAETEIVPGCTHTATPANIITIRRKPKVTMTVREDITTIGKTTTTEEENTEVHSRGNETGIIRSPLPGVITGIKVSISDSVRVGTELAVLEAMKMENTIESEYDGSIVEIYVSKGDSVLEGSPLMKIQ